MKIAPNAPMRTFRADWLDACRGLLAMWVVLTHITIWFDYIGSPVPSLLHIINVWLLRIFTPTYETHPAVLAFIVLSGYCIHRNGLRTSVRSGAGKEGGEIRAFAIRRFFRIYPVFILALMFGYTVFLTGMHLASDLTQTLMVTTDVSPICLILRGAALLSLSSQAANLCGHLGNAPLATVMVEIALYIAYPLILLGVSTVKARVLVISLPFISGMLLAWLIPEMQWWWHNSSLLNFLVFWWIGAYFANDDLRAPGKYRLLGLLAIWVLCTLLLFATPILLIAEVRKLIAAVLFAYLFVWHDRPTTSFWLATFGRTGYSLYAFHMPIIVLLVVLGQPWWMCLIVCAAAGFFGYRFIELPSIYLGSVLIKKMDQHMLKNGTK